MQGKGSDAQRDANAHRSGAANRKRLDRAIAKRGESPHLVLEYLAKARKFGFFRYNVATHGHFLEEAARELGIPVRIAPFEAEPLIAKLCEAYNAIAVSSDADLFVYDAVPFVCRPDMRQGVVRFAKWNLHSKQSILLSLGGWAMHFRRQRLPDTCLLAQHKCLTHYLLGIPYANSNRLIFDGRSLPSV